MKILTFDLVTMLILKLMLNRDSEIVVCLRFVNCDMNSTLGSGVPLAMFLHTPFVSSGQVFSPRVYTSQGVPISVTGIAQVLQKSLNKKRQMKSKPLNSN